MVVMDKSKCCLGMAKPVLRRVIIWCGLDCGVTGTARGGSCRCGGVRAVRGVEEGGTGEGGAGVNPEGEPLPGDLECEGAGGDPGKNPTGRGMHAGRERGVAWVAGPARLGGGDAIGRGDEGGCGWCGATRADGARGECGAAGGWRARAAQYEVSGSRGIAAGEAGGLGSSVATGFSAAEA